DLVSLGQLTQTLAQLRADPNAAPATARPAATNSAAGRGLPETRVTRNSLAPVVEAPAPAANVLALSADTVAQVWPQIVRQVGSMLGSDLEKAGLPAISGPNTLVLTFPAEYNVQREHCQSASGLAKIEEALRKATGRAWMVRIDSGPSTPAP